MPGHREFLRGSLTAAALLALCAGSAAAQSTSSQAPARSPCFFVTQWQGWSSPSPNVLYLRINNRDIYRVDLSAGSSMLRAPDMHLVSINRGSNSICSAIDLDLKIADNHGFSEPLIAKKLTKLSPEEAAAIPKKFRPN